MNTVVAPLLNEAVIGYPYISFVDKAVRSEIGEFQDRLEKAFADKLWMANAVSLHITFLHLLSPDVEYAEPEDKLYDRAEDAANEAMLRVGREFGPVTIDAGEVLVSPQAIIVRWDVHGRLDRLRDAFTTQCTVPEPTKRPPNIVHTTTSRFLEPLPIDRVWKVAQELRVTALPTIAEIELVRESRICLQKFDVVSRYPLAGKR